jgi:spermidine/putrescine transport system ATP-binding protein
MTNDTEVELLGVTKRFGDSAAVDSVSLSVMRGEFLTLLGPSGCGKTTLLRLIGGFATPDEGRILLSGKDVTSLPPYRRNVSTVFQQYALFPHMNVFENVAFGLRLRRVSADELSSRVAYSLEMVRLSGMETRLPAELSGGQQQRVALARSIVLNPRVLLLDEPLAALDLKLRKQMQIELKGLQRKLGISFVFVTHDQEEALTMSDRIAVISGGQIQQVGNARDVYERPVNAFVADFIGLSNIFKGAVESSDGQFYSIRVGPHTVGARAPDGSSSKEHGESVSIMVRPERIQLLSPEADSGLCGKIQSQVYLGESTRWTVRLDDGTEIQVVEQNSEVAGAAAFGPGSDVAVRWEPASAVLLS